MRKVPPQNIDSALRDALASHQQGQVDIAEKLYAGVLKTAPNNFDALHLLGLLRLQTGKPAEAQRLIASALRIRPDSADALTNLGSVFGTLKRPADALASFDKALAIVPDHIDALSNRGLVLLELGQPAEAISCCDRVLARRPDDVFAPVTRADALLVLGHIDEAIIAYDAALARNAENPRARLARAHALTRAGRYADALAEFERLLVFAPREPEVLSGRGLALQALGRYDDALAAYARAILVDKTYAEAHFGEAIALLATGDYRMGFAQYEWRWKRAGAARRSFGKPLWLGEYPLGHRVILLHADGDVGETIQFVRYAPLLARGGARVVLEVQPELLELACVFKGVDVVARGAALPAFDLHCPLGSLPLACKTSFEGVPADIPYLRASAERVAAWRARLDERAGPRVALAWSGGPSPFNDAGRSVAFERLRPLLETPGVTFVDIECEHRKIGEENLREHANFVRLGPEHEPFYDAAAVIALSDLVVTADNAIAHLAAAMGRPVWILLPAWAGWRWTRDRDTSPWYPQARLFRQASPGDWDGVVARVASEIAAKLAT